MMRRKITITSLGVLFAMAAFRQVSAAAVSCESLASLSLPNTTITSAQSVAAGAYTPPTAAGGQGNQGFGVQKSAGFLPGDGHCETDSRLRSP